MSTNHGVTPDIGNHHSPEDRRHHLALIQGIVTRMASASASAKGWLLPIIVATYSFALIQHQPWVAALGCGAALLFAYLDAHYLDVERQFRELYARVVDNDPAIPPYCLSPNPERLTTQPRGFSRIWREIKNWCIPTGVWLSWSIFPFYSAIIIGGVITFFLASSTIQLDCLSP